MFFVYGLASTDALLDSTGKAGLHSVDVCMGAAALTCQLMMVYAYDLLRY
jgi:hypothetical protein